MQQFNFNVVDSRDPDAEVPSDVAEAVMADIQRLISDTGELMIRQELRTQNSLPNGVSDRFLLRADPTVDRADGTLLEDTMLAVLAELDRANLSLTSPPETSNHIEAEGRRRIAKDLLDLADHLDGYVLRYGQDGVTRRFRFNGRAAAEKEACIDISSKVSAVIGVVSRDPARRNRWVVSNGIDTVPVTFSDSVSVEDRDYFTTLGPVILTGSIIQGQDGTLTEVRNVSECYEFPLLRFRRIVTPSRDLPLFNPVDACVSYDRSKGAWNMSNEYLFIDVSKPSWDEAVAAFHDYFMFLWETYAESDGPFEGEESETREFLLSLSFP